MPRKTDILRVKLVADGGGQVRADVLGVDDSFGRLEKSSLSLSKGLRSLSGIFAVLSAGAITAAVKNSIAFADSIDKAAERAGFGAQALQELRFAADQVGVSTQQLDDGLRRFTRRIGIFVAEGGGPAAKTLERLGIAVKTASGEVRSSEAIFTDVVSALEGVQSAAERSAIAAQLFGDDAGPQLRLLLDQGAAGIRNLREEAQDIGAVLSEDIIDNAVQAQDDLAKLTSVVKVQLTAALVELAPVLSKAANGVISLVKGIRSFFNLSTGNGIKDIENEIGRLEGRLDTLNTKLGSFVSGLIPGERGRLSKEIEETETRIRVLNLALEQLKKTSDDEPLGGLAESAAEASGELGKIVDRLNPLQARAKQYAAELKVIEASNLGLKEQAELVQQLQKEFADATGAARDLKDSTKDAGAEIKKQPEATASAINDPFNRAAENIQRSFGDTFTEIFRQGQFRFETLSDAIRDIFARLAGEIAALLVFRPQILFGGGLGGLGLFGSTGAAGGLGTAAGGGGIGALLAGGGSLAPLALAGLGGLGGAFTGNALSSSLGIETNFGGTAGGLLGGLGGAYGGLLLGSATALGPLGIPIGAFLGGLGGNLLGNILGGGLGGNNKQKIGFTTGLGGVSSALGDINVTAQQNIDSQAIVRSIQSIDAAIARLLSPGQLSTARGALAGTGQFFSANTFDNEIFDLVKTRLTRVIDSLADNNVASQLLNRVGRSPENVDALVGEAGRIIELINLFADEGEPLNDAEQALAALNEQFDALRQVAIDLGFSIEEVNARAEDATKQLTDDFNSSIREQILAIENPLQAALNAERELAEARLENARTLKADIDEVTRLNTIRRSSIIDQAFAGSNAGIESFLQSLRITGAGGLGVGAQASNAETLFNTLLPAARSDPAARAQLVSILPSLLNLKREQLGSTTDFFAFTNFLQTTLAGLVDESATVATLDDIGQAITDGDNAIVTQLDANNTDLIAAVEGLRNDINLLLNSPAAA